MTQAATLTGPVQTAALSRQQGSTKCQMLVLSKDGTDSGINPDETEPTTAFSRVFQVAELVEQIFVQLTMKDLLCSVQPTCRQWRDFTLTSNPIRELLFLKPISTRPLFYYPHITSWSKAQAEGIDTDYWADRLFPQWPRTVIAHPYIDILTVKPSYLNPAFKYPGASWRKHLLTQPPVGEIFVETLIYEGIHLSRTCTGAAGFGVTMGDVAQAGIIDTMDGWSHWVSRYDYESLQRLQRQSRRLLGLKLRGMKKASSRRREQFMARFC